MDSITAFHSRIETLCLLSGHYSVCIQAHRDGHRSCPDYIKATQKRRPAQKSDPLFHWGLRVREKLEPPHQPPGGTWRAIIQAQTGGRKRSTGQSASQIRGAWAQDPTLHFRPSFLPRHTPGGKSEGSKTWVPASHVGDLA